MAKATGPKRRRSSARKAKGAQPKPRHPTRRTDRPPNPALARFRANYPAIDAMVQKAAANDGKGPWLKLPVHAAEARAVMDKHGLKEELGDLRSAVSEDDEDCVGGESRSRGRRQQGRGTDFGPLGAGWSVWVSYSELARAYQAATSAVTAGDSVAGVEMRGTGGPTPAGDSSAGIGEPDQVRVAVRWHHSTADVLTSMLEDRRRGTAEETQVSEGGESSEKGGEELKAPESLRLPPKLPAPRETNWRGVVEQYERFICYEGETYSPICQWGNARRPDGFNTATLSDRLIHYCGARTAGTCDEQDDRSLNDLKLDGKKYGNTKPAVKIGGSKWAKLAAELYAQK